MSNTFVTTVRFNLDREEDRLALKYLQGEGRERFGSYTQAIIALANDAISAKDCTPTREADGADTKEEALFQRIAETVRHAIEDSPIGSIASLLKFLQAIPAMPYSAPPEQQIPIPQEEETNEEDWEAVDDFLGGL